MKKGLVSISGLVLLASLAACSVPNKTYSTSLNEKDFAVINTLFDDAPTYCLWRYTFNYPKSLTQNLSSIIKIDDMTIESQFIYPPSFKQRVDLREEELKKHRVSDDSDGPFLKDIIRLDNGVIFERNEAYQYPDVLRVLEANVYIDNVAFIITSKFEDVSKSKYVDEQLEYTSDH